ncbi:hypothetical protein GALMADRAFT_242227 [Galerina marginata CBS 339.88]|uniref:Uncharacterized protein n=1 Tax=Galerina marginata (strain CBS 339.88) TaxID=685588 RepID=A0A067TM48_GALM3|nr:hypothetical protein GALMADRAFT_242227 [Galerina marginata CBS 339.88]
MVLAQFGLPISFIYSLDALSDQRFGPKIRLGRKMAKSISSKVSTARNIGGTRLFDPGGCTVVESAPNSFGEGFNNAAGDIFATWFDASG